MSSSQRRVVTILVSALLVSAVVGAFSASAIAFNGSENDFDENNGGNMQYGKELSFVAFCGDDLSKDDFEYEVVEVDGEKVKFEYTYNGDGTIDYVTYKAGPEIYKVNGPSSPIVSGTYDDIVAEGPPYDGTYSPDNPCGDDEGVKFDNLS